MEDTVFKVSELTFRENKQEFSMFSLTHILTVVTPKTLFQTLKVGKGPKRCIYDQYKIIFIYLWIRILMYFWFKRQELSIFWQ